MQAFNRIYTSLVYRFSRKLERSSTLLLLYKSICFKLLTPKDIKQTPIFINNRNHYSYLKDLIDWLRENNFKNYYVIDNDSNYSPLLEYYTKELNGRVIYLEKNSGHLSFWNERILSKVKNSFYIYTDSDVLPVLNNSPRFLEILYEGLKKSRFALKAGCAIKIDDLPDYFSTKEKVIWHEEQFWKKPLTRDVYHADVDTTFSLYLPNYFWDVGKTGWGNHIRVAGDCIIRHQPWYEDSNNLTEEQIYYKASAQTSTHWTNLANTNKAK